MRTFFSLFKDGYTVMVAIASIGLLFEFVIQIRKKSPIGMLIGLLLTFLSAALFILHRITLSNEALICTYIVAFFGVGLIVYSGYRNAKRVEDKNALLIKKIVIGWIILLAACIFALVAVFIAKNKSSI